MIKFIGSVVVLVSVAFFVYFVVYKRLFSGKSLASSLQSMDEDDLVKKFNSLVNKLKNGGKGRTIDNIANDLLALLKEYKCRKIEQFVESEQLLNKNKNHLVEEIAKVEKQIVKLKADAKALVKENMTDEDYELGGMYMVQIEETERLNQELKNTQVENQTQLDRVDKQVQSFNAKYTLKEGSIMNMIIKAKTHKGLSDVDLKLNDLISEFNDKVQDAEIEQKVRAQIQGTQEETEDVSPVFAANKEDYINRFKELVNK